MMLIILLFLLLTCTLFHHVTTTNQNQTQTHLQPTKSTMDPFELQTLYTIMETLSSEKKWRTTYPTPCTPSTSWVGIECKQGVKDSHFHVTRLDFGTPPNPSCKKLATFPSQIFQLPYLQSIFFFQCFTKTKTTISVPKNPSLGFNQPSSLQQLSLRSNPNLVGTIPPQLFTHLSSLQIFTLSQSKISGKIPLEIFKVTSLVHLDLSYNHFGGTIPNELSNLRNLVGLDLSYNTLMGSIPNAIGQLGMLQKLDLSSNSLTGSVPSSIEKLGSLEFLALSNNKLHGKLPRGFENLKGLESLIMESNPMSIDLPVEFGLLPKLQELRLGNSEYSGEIPLTFTKLLNLTTLSLQNNRLTGNIPMGFVNLSHIYHLNLSRNFLSGEIPFDTSFLKRLGKNMDLSENKELCLDPMESYESEKLGVDVCNGSSTRVGNGSSSRVTPLKNKSDQVRVVGLSRYSLFFLILICLCVL